MSAKELARGGILTGLGVAALYLGGLSEYFETVACIAAGVASAVPMMRNPRFKEAFLVYTATGLLGLLVVPQKLLVFGYIGVCGLYPILKYFIESRVPRNFQICVKLAYCNFAIFCAYLVIRLALNIEIRGALWCVSVLLGANLMFFLYDVALSRVIALLKRMLPR